MEQRIHRLSLDVTPTGEIQHMRLEEIDGAVTEFAFTQVQENVPTHEADFVFTAPDGVTIVNALSPV
jgi:outer membrane lipoprotein carrier protein